MYLCPSKCSSWSRIFHKGNAEANVCLKAPCHPWWVVGAKPMDPIKFYQFKSFKDLEDLFLGARFSLRFMFYFYFLSLFHSPFSFSLFFLSVLSPPSYLIIFYLLFSFFSPFLFLLFLLSLSLFSPFAF